ncbi:MAG: multidrug efflux RND transporter permease subunit [Candidatus Obscuribacterales bacterium]|nr:multidrug efflux RND transporter permease subunit [Candidatus Obscuribacterales bacterium]
MIDFFIKRPIFSAVCSMVILLCGIVCIPVMPVAQYPDISPPRVGVTANYTGASAQVVENSVTSLLEQQINGATGIKYISSTSGNDGTATVNVTFDLERDIDLAAVDIQTRLAAVNGRLPDEVKKTGVNINKASTAFVMAIGMISPDGRYDSQFLSNYSDLYIRDALKRVPGVGDCQIFGERKYSMRIWLDPAKLSRRKLTPSDVVRAVSEQNIQTAAGQIGQAPTPSSQKYQISVRARSRLNNPEEFAEIIVKTGQDGTLVRVKDVGRVELGAEDYQSRVRYLNREAVGMGIFQRPGSNSIQVAEGVRKEMERLAHHFPPGMEYDIAFDTTLAVKESIREVLLTLAQAIALVVLVIFVFLQNWRSTLIPAITIPVSLVGTFAFLHVLGFSINTLTLFGITLATGLVVDDAIVVLENISRFMEAKRLSAPKAASAAMAEVTGAVIAISLVLAAVFIPVAFFPGTTGRLYKQFALTIAMSVAISTFIALTLTPALAALWLKPTGAKHKPDDSHQDDAGGKGKELDTGYGAVCAEGGYAQSHAVAPEHELLEIHTPEPSRFLPFALFNKSFEMLTKAYRHTLYWTLKLKAVTLLLFLAMMAATWWLYKTVPSSFIPNEDLGYFITIIQSPEGVALNYTEDVLKRVEKELDKIPEIDGSFGIAGFGFSGNNPGNGIIFSNLKEWKERNGPGQDLDGIVARLRGPLSQITDATVVPFNPPAIEGLGSFGGFVFELQDLRGLDFAVLDQATQALCREANQSKMLAGVFSSYKANSPQLLVNVDRNKAKALGVNLGDVFDTLGTLLGSSYVNDFDMGTRIYRVYVQADQEYRANPASMSQYYVRSQSGDMIPLSSLITVTKTTSPQNISHYNLFRSTEINGAAAPGYSSGTAMKEMERIAAKVLPLGMGYEWSGISQEEMESGTKTVLIFSLGLLFVFLVLAAQYESFADPLIILFAVPLAMLGALLAQWMRGLQNDVFCQIGLVMLIGLASKNAILIVEFANQLKRNLGLSAEEAVKRAAEIRLRPILMTSLAFIMGILPLVFATGAGAGSRHSLGTAVCGGMIVSTVLSVYMVPVIYVLVSSIRDRLLGRGKKRPSPQPAGTTAPSENESV